MIGLRIEEAERKAQLARRQRAVLAQATFVRALKSDVDAARRARAAADGLRERTSCRGLEPTTPSTPEPSMRTRALRELERPRRRVTRRSRSPTSHGGTRDLAELGYDALDVHVPYALLGRWLSRRELLAYRRVQTPEPRSWAGSALSGATAARTDSARLVAHTGTCLLYTSPSPRD